MTIIKKFVRFFIKTELLKKTLLFALKELAKATDNSLDDQFVRTIEARLYPKKKVVIAKP